MIVQFASNMLRRTFCYLLFCGLLAACCCTVLRQNIYYGVPIPKDCDKEWNSTECRRRVQEIVSGSDPIWNREGRKVEERSFGGRSEEVEEVTSRRKKNKGYGQLLLYFMGASKLTMLYGMVSTIAAIAGKALVVGKVALAIATAIALEKAFHHKEKVSYEIIKHPHHSFEHSHSSSIDYDHQGGWENDINFRELRRVYQ